MGYQGQGMRTSPPPMRPARRPRAAASLVTALATAIVLLGAGCSDDEPTGADDPTPTTTAPRDTATSPTTDAAGTSDTTEGPSGTGDAGGALTAETATAELEALMEVQRDVYAQLRTQGALDERSLRELTRVFTASHAANELDGLRSVGGPTVIAESPAVPTVGAVEVLDATETCASLTADIPGVVEMVTIPVTYDPPYYVRLLPAPEGAEAPAWRIDFIASSNNGLPIEEARCP
jgi:hypothetical protein